MTKLTASEQTFFFRFNQAVMANPFTDERKVLHNLVADQYLKSQPKGVHFFKTLQPILNLHINQLQQRNLSTIQDFTGGEQRLLYFSYIVATYLDYVEQIDTHIQQQLKATNSCVAFGVGNEIIEQLVKRGFSDQEALRLLELYFQFRRAYLFISNDLVGQCESMTRLRESLWNNLFTFDVFHYHQGLWNNMEDFSLFIIGETGTGKGAAAHALGQSTHISFDQLQGAFKENFNNTFIAANLSQFSETLIESELFGHQKGAFTGAVDKHKGLFSQCNKHGLLFLDEIGEVSENIQIKLLKVLQERSFCPVGSYQEEKFHGRVVAAANKPLQQLRYENKLRDDFYYRLCSDVIEIPTLRLRLSESSAELEILVTELVSRICGDEQLDIADKVLTTLQRDVDVNYQWPGNVRELEQAIRRVLLTGSYQGDDSYVDKQSGSIDKSNSEIQSHLTQSYDDQLDVKAFVIEHCFRLYQKYGNYETVAKKTKLDRRTVKKYVQQNSLAK